MITAKYTHPNNGSELNRELSQSLLTEGAEYEVVYGEIYSYCSYVYFRGCDKAFNTVQFDFYKDGEPIDIVKEKIREWNQYTLRPTDSPFNHSLHRSEDIRQETSRFSMRKIKNKVSRYINGY